MVGNQKGFANIILVVIIVVLVSATGYFVFVKKSEPVAQQPTLTPIQTTTPTKTPVSLTPTPDKISTWKTYTNSQYGFEVKYPKDWELTARAILLGSLYDEEFYINKSASKERVRIAVTSNHPSLLLSPDGPVKERLIAGIPAHEQRSEGYSDAGESSGPFVELWIKNNELYYSFIFYNTREISGDYNQILSTFKFTNSVSKDEFAKVTIDTLARNPSSFLSKKVQITGKLILTGKNYFTDPRFAVTDGANQFQVSAWLVLEVPPPMPGSTGGQPSTMATYLDKTLTLQGTVEQDNQVFFLRVTNTL